MRGRPCNADRIHVLLPSEIDHYPLRMNRVILTSKAFCEIWIAFPVSVEIAIVEPGETVKFRSAIPRKTAMLQGVAI